MRISILFAFAGLALAQAPQPAKVVFARVFPQPGQIGLFLANADGSNEHALVAPADIDYDAAWAPDGASIVFTSERSGSADLYRVKPDGTGLERLTDSSAYDDQAAFSPDGKQLVFVSTRAGGTADLWTMDVQTRRAKALTSGPGGDFRPSWSPDGQWIAFSSDRTSDLPFAHGRWEHLQLVDVYVIHPDGSGLKRLTPHGGFCGSPKWTADSRRVVAYCMTAQQTMDNRRAAPEHPEDTRVVSVDINSGVTSDLPVDHGVNFNPSVLSGDVLAYIRKDGDERGIHYSNGKRGPAGDIRTAAWSPDGMRVVFHKRVAFQRKPWVGTWSRNPQYELTLTSGGPSFSPAGDRYAFVGPAQNAKGAGVGVAAVGGETTQIVYRDPARNVLGPQWSPAGDRIIFGIGIFDAFFNGFHGVFLKPEDRVEGGAQVAMVNPDGSGFRELTSGPNNNAFPSMSPDGRRFVYRTFGPDGDGLRIMDIETKRVTPIAGGYDNFPLWSPRGDLIMFSRQDEGDYEIYTIKPDGTGLRRLTHSRGNDAHMAWSPDGNHIVFASTRMGFKDEAVYTDAPQPYGEIFVMRADGSDVQQLTDNQWEEGTPAWQPARRLAAVASGQSPDAGAACEKLATLLVPAATITRAQLVPAGTFAPPGAAADSAAFRALPAFCRVAATVKPSSDSDIKIEVWMPAAGWNGRFQAVGNGAFNGDINYAAMRTALARGYATSSTDTGHTGGGASWALGHPEKVVDFGWRAVHEMTTVAKRIIASHYDRSPAFSYWNGCSAGGRQGMKAAQRFPGDFDGIIAGAPGLNWTSRASQAVRVAKTLEANEAVRLSQTHRQLLHTAVVNACDALDGVKDGLIENPQRCTFDPGILECKSSTETVCLTKPQVDTARLTYSSGLAPGSELGWTDLGWTASARATGLDQFRFIVFGDPTWTVQKFNVDSDISRAVEADRDTINALDPNLQPFIDRGGKLMQYHGWSDPQISPFNSTQYYSRVVEALGGTSRVDGSYRLFMAPGMGHCGGGEGPNTFDVVGALEQWVERRQAPNQIIASHSTNGVADRTRPLCPYPKTAVYTGTGSADDAKNFACKAASR